ncbi:MAG TPA: CoA-binding protein [Candidatus Thermoplasmatota archaeon]|nr:CoA-binding protein [Candidatus Thermoplasmatota archaeon]
MDDPVDLLRRSKRIAVVGASGTPGKDAHEIPKHLLEQGYDVLPVNPRGGEMFGRQAYKSLAEVPGPVDLVNVFRPSEEAPAIAREAVAAGAKAIWLQSGLESEEAARIAREAGLAYVENACVRTVQRRLAHVDAQKNA